MNERSASPDYFELMYRENPDPWGYGSDDYEAEKYNATCAALGGRRFQNGFEVGCSIGILSRRLAAHCQNLLAVDLSPTALTRARLDAPANIAFERMAIPGAWPDRCFDLIVLSEVLYYLSDADLAETAARTRQSLARDGVVLLVNWLGDTGVPATGDGAAEAFIQATQPDLTLRDRTRAARYRLDRLSR